MRGLAEAVKDGQAASADERRRLHADQAHFGERGAKALEVVEVRGQNDVTARRRRGHDDRVRGTRAGPDFRERLARGARNAIGQRLDLSWRSSSASRSRTRSAAAVSTADTLVF